MIMVVGWLGSAKKGIAAAVLLITLLLIATELLDRMLAAMVPAPPNPTYLYMYS